MNLFRSNTPLLVSNRTSLLWVALATLLLTPELRAELRIPAFTAYIHPNVNGARVSERGGVTGWRRSPAIMPPP